MKKYLMILFAACFAAVSLRAQMTPAAAADVSETVRPGPERSVTFTVTVQGTAPFTYQWRKDGIAIPGATASTYRIAPIALSDAGVYTAAVTNEAGSTLSSKATLNVIVLNPPVVTGLTIEKDKPAGTTANTALKAGTAASPK